MTSLEYKNNYKDHRTVFNRTHCLYFIQDMFRKNGGILKDNEGVTNITPGSVIIVQTSKGQYSCKSIILTVGPWAKQLLPTLGIHIPLKVCIKQEDVV